MRVRCRVVRLRGGQGCRFVVMGRAAAREGLLVAAFNLFLGYS